jgi:hypothetical protein
MFDLANAFAARFNGGVIRLFDAAPAAAPDDAEVGTLLGIVSLGGTGAGLQYLAAPAYVYNPPSDPWVFKALASGTVKSFRVVATGDTGGFDPDAFRIDGTIGVPFSGADMEWQSVDVVKDAVYTLDSFVYIVHPLPRT